MVNSSSFAYASESTAPSTTNIVTSTSNPAAPSIDSEIDAVFTLEFERDEMEIFHMTKYISTQRILKIQQLQQNLKQLLTFI